MYILKLILMTKRLEKTEDAIKDKKNKQTMSNNLQIQSTVSNPLKLFEINEYLLVTTA